MLLQNCTQIRWPGHLCKGANGAGCDVADIPVLMHLIAVATADIELEMVETFKAANLSQNKAAILNYLFTAPGAQERTLLMQKTASVST